MTALNLSNGCAPERITPLMKNGRRAVDADLTSASASSLSTLSAHVWAARPALNLAMSFTPASCAHFS